MMIAWPRMLAEGVTRREGFWACFDDIANRFADGLEEAVRKKVERSRHLLER